MIRIVIRAEVEPDQQHELLQMFKETNIRHGQDSLGSDTHLPYWTKVQ
ncbi:MAG TPA: hypothetical protein VMO00_15890 [Methylomirabilota bacterium]|nr:hypothetical protein [Methylomirabilota bacterium]